MSNTSVQQMGNPVPYSIAKQIITAYFAAGVVPLLSGSPGIGKSALIKEIAQEHNLKVIDLRLTQCDPTELNAI